MTRYPMCFIHTDFYMDITRNIKKKNVEHDHGAYG